MKKLIALFLTILLVASLAACGEREETPGPTEPVQENVPQEETETKFVPGVIQDMTYESEFMGLGCHIDDGWRFYTDREINQMNGVTAELVGEELAAVIAEADLIYDMVAVSGGVENININFEKVEKSVLEVLDVAENFRNMIPAMEEAYGQMGATDILLEAGTVMVDGVNKDCLHSSFVLDGVTMVQVVIGIKCEGYLANVTVTAANQERLEEVLEYLYLI